MLFYTNLSCIGNILHNYVSMVLQGARKGSTADDPPSYHRSQIPPPRPPRTLKTDVFSAEKYKEVDDYVISVSTSGEA